MDILGALAFLLWGIIGLAGVVSEKERWNNGVCKQSGKSWRLFDIDSQGDRGYTDDEGNYCWVSYPLIDRKNKGV